MFIGSLLIFLIFIIIKMKKPLQILQQNFYNENNRYLKWIYHNPSKVFINYELVSFLLLIIGLLSDKLLIVIISIFYLIISYLTYDNYHHEQVKLPLKVTNRIVRLILTTIFIYILIFGIIILNYQESNLFFYYLIIILLVYLLWFVVYFANIINKPLEKLVFLYFRTKAISKLNSFNNLEVIGITGSYGKTSCKNILNEILNVKYNAIATPKSFNTQYGLILTINNNIDKFQNYFIAEMGAFKRGRIIKLARLVKPKYGIITTIGDAHLETFGSRENIQLGKFELIESLPSDGVGVLNYDDEYQKNYPLKNKCQILWVSMKNKDAYVYAKDVKIEHNCMTFKCLFKGDMNEYQFETKLLGKANIYNIIQAIALGKYLGMSIEEIKRGVKSIHPIEHRLELKKIGTLNIIDDAYNSNPVGAKMALDVLNIMPGMKVIITPGMIELGSLQHDANYEFGKNISKVCDKVILVGQEQTKDIYQGLKDSNYPKDNIIIINDVKEAFSIVKKLSRKDIYVLLENDLPDTFNEK